MLIGSRNRAHFHLVSTSVSKMHAALIVTDAGVYIRDLASRTHVIVNGKPVTEAMLASGDEVAIGTFIFRFVNKAPQKSRVAASVPPAMLEMANESVMVPMESRTVLIGRKPLCDVHLIEASVSTTHALIYEQNGAHFIRDLASRTGTFVNGQPIHAQQLQFGDAIRVGESDMRFVPAAAEHFDELEDLVGTAKLSDEADLHPEEANLEMPRVLIPVAQAPPPLATPLVQPIPRPASPIAEAVAPREIPIAQVVPVAPPPAAAAAVDDDAYDLAPPAEVHHATVFKPGETVPADVPADDADLIPLAPLDAAHDEAQHEEEVPFAEPIEPLPPEAVEEIPSVAADELDLIPFAPTEAVDHTPPHEEIPFAAPIEAVAAETAEATPSVVPADDADLIPLAPLEAVHDTPPHEEIPFAAPIEPVSAGTAEATPSVVPADDADLIPLAPLEAVHDTPPHEEITFAAPIEAVAAETAEETPSVVAADDADLIPLAPPDAVHDTPPHEEIPFAAPTEAVAAETAEEIPASAAVDESELISLAAVEAEHKTPQSHEEIPFAEAIEAVAAEPLDIAASESADTDAAMAHVAAVEEPIDVLPSPIEFAPAESHQPMTVETAEPVPSNQTAEEVEFVPDVPAEFAESITAPIAEEPSDAPAAVSADHDAPTLPSFVAHAATDAARPELPAGDQPVTEEPVVELMADTPPVVEAPVIAEAFPAGEEIAPPRAETTEPVAIEPIESPVVEPPVVASVEEFAPVETDLAIPSGMTEAVNVTFTPHEPFESPSVEPQSIESHEGAEAPAPDVFGPEAEPAASTQELLPDLDFSENDSPASTDGNEVAGIEGLEFSIFDEGGGGAAATAEAPTTWSDPALHETPEAAAAATLDDIDLSGLNFASGDLEPAAETQTQVESLETDPPAPEASEPVLLLNLPSDLLDEEPTNGDTGNEETDQPMPLIDASALRLAPSAPPRETRAKKPDRAGRSTKKKSRTDTNGDTAPDSPAPLTTASEDGHSDAELDFALPADAAANPQITVASTPLTPPLEIIEATDPTPESAQTLAAEAPVEDVPSLDLTVDDSALTDSTFGRAVEEFSGTESAPIIESLAPVVIIAPPVVATPSLVSETEEAIDFSGETEPLAEPPQFVREIAAPVMTSDAVEAIDFTTEPAEAAEALDLPGADVAEVTTPGEPPVVTTSVESIDFAPAPPQTPSAEAPAPPEGPVAVSFEGDSENEIAEALPLVDKETHIEASPGLIPPAGLAGAELSEAEAERILSEGPVTTEPPLFVEEPQATPQVITPPPLESPAAPVVAAAIPVKPPASPIAAERLPVESPAVRASTALPPEAKETGGKKFKFWPWRRKSAEPAPAVAASIVEVPAPEPDKSKPAVAPVIDVAKPDEKLFTTISSTVDSGAVAAIDPDTPPTATSFDVAGVLDLIEPTPLTIESTPSVDGELGTLDAAVLKDESFEPELEGLAQPTVAPAAETELFQPAAVELPAAAPLQAENSTDFDRFIDDALAEEHAQPSSLSQAEDAVAAAIAGQSATSAVIPAAEEPIEFIPEPPALTTPPAASIEDTPVFEPDIVPLEASPAVEVPVIPAAPALEFPSDLIADEPPSVVAPVEQLKLDETHGELIANKLPVRAGASAPDAPPFPAPPFIPAPSSRPGPDPLRGMGRDLGSFLGGLPLNLAAPLPMTRVFAATSTEPTPPASAADEKPVAGDTDIVTGDARDELEPSFETPEAQEAGGLESAGPPTDLFESTPESLDQLPDSMHAITDVVEVIGEKPQTPPASGSQPGEAGEASAPSSESIWPARRDGPLPPRPRLGQRALTVSPFDFSSQPATDLAIPPVVPEADTSLRPPEKVTTAFDGLAMPPAREADVFSQTSGFAMPATPPAAGAQARLLGLSAALPDAVGRMRADADIPRRPRGVGAPPLDRRGVRPPPPPAELPANVAPSAPPPAVLDQPRVRRPDPAPQFFVPPAPMRETRSALPLRWVLPAVLLLALAVAAGIWFFYKINLPTHGRLRFENLDRLTIEDKQQFLDSERAILRRPDVIGFARRLYLSHPGADLNNGFLSDTHDEDRKAYDAIVKGLSISPDSTQLLMSTVGPDPAGDGQRMAALLQELYTENQHFADDAATAQQAYEKSRDAADHASNELAGLFDSLKQEEQDAVNLTVAEQTLEQLKNKGTALWQARHDATQAVHDAQQQVERLQSAPPATAAPAAEGQTAATPTDADRQLKELETRLTETTASLAKMRAARSAAADSANKALDEALTQFRDRIDQARSSLADGSQLGTYLVAAQQAQDTIRQLNADLIEREKAEQQRLADLRRSLAEKQAARLDAAWSADSQLKDMQEDLSVAEHRYNAAVGSGLDADAAQLKANLDALKQRIDARRDLIATGDIYADEVKSLQQFIDDSLKQMEAERIRADARMGEMLKTLAAAAPKIEKLPADQQALAESLEKQLDGINHARQLQSQVEAAANPDADSSVQNLEATVTELQAKLDARRKQIADDNQKAQSAQQEQARAAALAAAKTKLAAAQQDELASAAAMKANQDQTDAAYNLVEGLKVSAARLPADTARVGQLQRDLPNLKAETDRLFAQWKNIPVPQAPSEDSVTTSTAQDPRLEYILISTLGFAMLAVVLLTINHFLQHHVSAAPARHDASDLPPAVLADTLESRGISAHDMDDESAPA